MDKVKKALKKREAVFETTEVLTTNVYKVSPEQKEEHDRLTTGRIEKLQEDAIPNILERYEQRLKEIQLQRQSNADGGEMTTRSKK
ncbi:hypothetical protein WMW72_16790 [Paenibacillus filicis]|uniref:Uncharacterized protein n=1 Tax=Paenibacillus filicis TaxID=669464 RepID=A0ABU9DL44_9BACL